ncbi:PaaI family thioesterase [Pontibacter actiniarum]|uniref:Thioesterase n=1 Tax=Pontibacter actiniarum TaxID=323450 RepID=A0A1X9YR30_9BACT|nr:PaaI family thioesterase [Pontibacter actiniarum]ARS35330.1 thioesterase [Pontibacter actiniarum]
MALKDDIADFLIREFPQTKVTVEAVGDKAATVRHKVGHAELRPGGTVSGPVMMAVADVALYVAILGEIGLEALTVTTNLTMNFLRKPSPTRDLIGACSLLKVGKRLVVGEVTIYSDGEEEPVAHAVGTYSIPPRA